MPALPPAGLVRAHARRWIAWAVLLLVALQAVVVPAQRTADRAHFHLARRVALEERAVQRNAPPEVSTLESWLSPPRALFRHKGDHDARSGSALALGGGPSRVHSDGPGHAHGDLAVHEHAAGRDDVVYRDAEAHASPTGTPSAHKRIAFDIDAVMQPEAALPAGLRGPAPAADVALNFCSRTEQPPERPPRRPRVTA